MSAAKATYWDSSAILSALCRDDNSASAIGHARTPGLHLLSSLAWSELHAVVARMRRERVAPGALLDAMLAELSAGTWRRITAIPDWRLTAELSRRWPLRGADLWHLALAKTMQSELAELTLLTFDARLAAAAAGEGLA